MDLPLFHGGPVPAPLHQAHHRHDHIINIEPHHAPAVLDGKTVGAGRTRRNPDHPHGVFLQDFQDDVHNARHHGENLYGLYQVHLYMKRLPCGDGPPEGQAVGIFQVVAEAKAAGQGGDADAERRNLPVNIESGRLPFHIPAQGQDDFRLGRRVHPLQTLHQVPDRQVRRADAGNRGDNAAEDMVESMVLTGRLNGHDVTDALHDTNLSVVPPAVAAIGAKLPVRNHPALPAIPDLVPKTPDGVREMMDMLLGLLQQVQGQSQSAAPSHAREGRYRIDRLSQQGGGIVLLICHVHPYKGNRPSGFRRRSVSRRGICALFPWFLGIVAVKIQINNER